MRTNMGSRLLVLVALMMMGGCGLMVAQKGAASSGAGAETLQFAERQQILASDGEAEIVAKAAHVLPRLNQQEWMRLERTFFVHFGPNTFRGVEWGNGHEDPLFLQMQDEPASAYAEYLPEAGVPAHNGQRVVAGQLSLQMQSDPFLGWTEMEGRHYLVRQLNDHKGAIEMEDLAGGGLLAYAEVCGELLARGHARSSDPILLAGYLGSGDGFAEAIARFGRLYADQTEKDWEELRRSGKAKS